MGKAEEVSDLPKPSYLIGVGYDGERGRAFLKLYEPESQRIYLYYDRTGHMPYCLSNLTVEEIKQNPRVSGYRGIVALEPVERYDPLHDRTVRMTKIVVSNPLAVGGRGGIRELIPTWESNIKYHLNYLYDTGLIPGMPYKVVDGEIQPAGWELPEEELEEIKRVLPGDDEEIREYAVEWARRLSLPVPRLRRVALDIEVFSPAETRIPDPRKAEYPVIAASIRSSDGRKAVFVLSKEGPGEELPGVDVVCCETEVELLRRVFEVLWDYPVVVTFNGDDFDLRYLLERAKRIDIPREQIPIRLGENMAGLKYGVHIDLYKFFMNRSIQVYAFSDRYREHTLQEVASSILGEGKVEIEKPVSKLSIHDLAEYCFRDADLTYRLTEFDDDLVMKLLMVLSRIAIMPIEDVNRYGVSKWILSLLRYEHRRRGMLIPNPEDILRMKGETVTRAVIKGKKYRGAIVQQPVPGAHFNVVVLDFASLYPSIIRNWNLSYETVRCPHEECMDNKVPGTPHWVCKKRRGLMSLVIGSLRDLRIMWYKPLSKDKRLPEESRRWYSVVQGALKVILNASYGVFGSDIFPLYCPPLAESTTAIGRYAMTETVKRAVGLGINVIYGDTDSVFLENPSKEQIEELLDWAERELRIKLDVDKVYRYAVFSERKKNYFGVYPDGTVDIKGLTGKKRHVPPFLKKAFFELVEILRTVRREEDLEGAKEKIRDLVSSYYQKLREKKIPLKDLAFYVMLSQAPEKYATRPQHVKAALQLKATGVELGAGDIIGFVKVRGERGVKPVQLASVDEVDVEKYIEHMRSMFEQVLDALGIDFDSLVGKPRGTTLEMFF